MADTETNALIADGTLLALSDDGRFVSYTTTDGGTQSLFVRNLQTGATTLVDTQAVTTVGSGASADTTGIFGGALSADGHYIFYSKGTHGGVQAGGGVTSLFVRDLQSGSAAPVEITPPYQTESYPGTARGFIPESISADGKYVLYYETFQDFADSSKTIQAHIRQDTTSGAQTVVASQPYYTKAALTPDGQRVVVDGQGLYDNVVDLQHGTTSRVDGGGDGAISDDGHYLAHGVFSGSDAYGNPVAQVAIHNVAFPSSSDYIASASALGQLGNGDSTLAAFSGDGRHVAFISNATNLVPGDNDGVSDLFIKDLDTNAIQLIGPATGGSKVFLSYDGSVVLVDNGNGISQITFPPPTIAITSVAGDGLINAADEKSSGVTVSGTSNIHDFVLVTITSPSGASVQTVTKADGSWSATVPVAGVADGVHAFQVQVTDRFGHTGSASMDATFDATPPTLTVDPVTSDNVINAAEAAQIQFLHGHSDAIGQTVTVTVDGVLYGRPVVTQGGTWQVGFAGGLTDGHHSIDAVVTDAAGNVTHQTKTFDVDTTAPKLAILSVAGDDVFNQTEGRGLVPVVGTSDAIGQTVTITADGLVRGTAVVQQDGTWSAQISLAGAHDATKVIATATDAVGNVGTGTATVLVDADTVRISVGSHGEQGEGDPLQTLGYHLDSLTPDGHYALIHTVGHSSFVPSDDPDFTSYELLKDLQTGTLTLLDRGFNGELSETGRELFQDADDGSLRVRDIASGSVSVIDADFAANHTLADRAHISTDGRYVVFDAPAGEFANVPDSDAATSVIVVDDLQTGSIRLLTSPSAGMASAPSNIAGADGSHVVAYALRAEDGTSQVYETNIETGQTVLVSATPSGAAGNDTSDGPSVSQDGRYVVFGSAATDLISGPQDANGRLYVRDMQTGTTSLVTSDASGKPIDTGDSYELQLAGLKGLAITDHSVAFGEYVSVSPDDHNQSGDIYIKDLDTGALTLGSSGGPDAAAFHYALTGDGKYLAYDSTDENVVSGDTNGLSDVYLHRTVALDTLTLDPIAGDDTISSAERSATLPVTGTASVIGGEVSVTVDGQEVGTATVQADGTWSASIDATALAAGQHAFAARVHDLSGFTASDGALVQVDPGGTSQEITISLAHDTGNSTTDHITSDPSIVVSTSLPGDTLLYSTDGTTFTGTPPVFTSDGEQKVVVRTVDAHGNQTAEASLSFVLDHTAPMVTSITTATTSPSNATTLTERVVFSEAVTGLDKTDFIVTSATGAAATVTTLTPVGSDGTTYDVGLTGMSGDGTLRLDFANATQVQDAAGNLASAYIGGAVTVLDHTAPTITLLRAYGSGNNSLPTEVSGASVVNAADIAGGLSFSAVTQGVENGGSISPASTGTFTLVGVSGPAAGVTVIDHVPEPDTAFSSPDQAGDGVFTLALKAGSASLAAFQANVPDGVYILKADVVDKAGNPATEVTRTILIDTTADAGAKAPLTVDDTADHLINAAEAKAVGFTVAGLDADATAVATFTDGTHTATASVTQNGIGTVDLSGLSEAVTSSLAITDAHANTASAAGNTVTLDTKVPAAPSQPTDASVVNGYVGASHDPTVQGPGGGDQVLSGTAEGGSTVTVYDGATRLGTTIADPVSGAWSYTLGTLADASSHAYIVTATDAAGNTGPASAVLAFLVDTTAPGIPGVALTHDTGASGTDSITRDASLTVTPAEAGGSLSYSVDNGAATSSYAATTLADGAHTVQVIQTDAAGNASAAGSISFVLDTTAPTVTIGSVSGSANHATGHTITGTLGAEDAGATVTVYDGTTVLGTAVSDGTGHFSLNFTDTKDGATHSYALTASATDLSGNVGVSAEQNFVFDYTSNRADFGTVVYDTTSHAGQVYALYEGLLDRAPDAAGAQSWMYQLDHDTSLAAVTQSFLASTEGQAHFAPGSSNAAYVEQLYETVLHRQGDAAGAQSWASLLDQGATRADVADQFVFSAEHGAELQPALSAGVYLADPTAMAVARLYYGLLDRAPDAGGLQAYSTSVHDGTSSLGTVAQSFLSSAEYVAGHEAQTDQQYVDGLYMAGLGRIADAAGAQIWQGLLAHGTSRADVALGILESPEAQQHLAGNIDNGWHLA